MADISGYLNNIRSAESGETVRDSIIQCLNKINNDNPNKTKPLNVTANGTYTSETGYSYNPVTVNVPAGGASNYTFEELEVTENGEYEPEEDNTMYKKVTVNVPQLANDLAPDGYTITQNGEYDPLLDGYDGYGKIIVNVNEATGDGPFTVEFYDKVVTDPTAKVIQTQTVNKNGVAKFDPTNGYPVSPISQSFVGWSPEPVNVTRDLKCYPRFADKQIVLGEISDDWSVICEKRGAGYPLGSYKGLAYGATFTDEEYAAAGMTPWSQYTADHVINFQGLAIKVAEGEDGTTSSWIWVTLSSSNDNGLVKAVPSNNWQSNGLWRDQVCRTFMNTLFFNHMTDIFKNAIKPVTKYSQYSTENHPPYDVEGEQDVIWIPSVREMIGTDEDDFLESEPPVYAYGSETIQETNFNKYVTQVPNSIAYFKDNLEMTASERDTFLYRNLGLPSPMRDMSSSSYASSLNLWTNGQFRHSRNNTNGGGGHYFNGEYTADQVIFGFCMG